MKILIYCGDSHEVWSPKSEQTGIGGSEEAVINISRELTKLGNEVVVCNRCEADAGEYDGVKYVDYLDYKGEECDVFIGWRNEGAWKVAKNYKLGYHWLHDTVPQERVMQALSLGAKKIMVLSKFHRRLYPDILNREVFLTQNGVNLSQFEQKVERVPHSLFWSSSYDRGLKELLEEIWPQVKLAIPDATLRIAYGFQTMEKILGADNENYRRTKDHLLDLMEQDGVTHLDRISHQEVAKEFLTADVWAYPTWWPEISCISAMKAQIGGAIPVIAPTAAVAETVQFGKRTDRGYYNDIRGNVTMPAEMIEQFTAKLIEALEADNAEERKQMQEWAVDNFNWSKVAEQWIKEFKNEM